MLPQRIPKKAKRASRWRSQAHCNFVRSHACSACGSTTNIEAAHVRLNGGAGIGQKPDDWRAVSLCAGPWANCNSQLGCHDRQHRLGEQTFWQNWGRRDPETLIAEFIKASPKRREIEQVMKERAGG